MSAVTDERILELLRGGHTIQQIADLHIVQRARVYRVGEDAGLRLNNQTDRMTGGPAKLAPISDTRSTDPFAFAVGACEDYGRDIKPLLEHPTAAVRRAAGKAHDAAVALHKALLERQATEAERVRVAAERAAAKADVERLEAQLRAAKARLTGKPTATSTGQSGGGRGWSGTVDYPVEEVRAWAKTQGLPSKGRFLNRDTVAAWRAAHPSEASGGV